MNQLMNEQKIPKDSPNIIMHPEGNFSPQETIDSEEKQGRREVFSEESMRSDIQPGK